MCFVLGRFALGMMRLLSMKVGECRLMNLNLRASLDKDAANFIRLSRHVQIFSLDLQGCSLNGMPLSFSECLTTLEEMRRIGRRRLKFIGLTRTGITVPMALQIAKAVMQLPERGQDEQEEVLEMLQVSILALLLSYGIDARLAADVLSSRHHD